MSARVISQKGTGTSIKRRISRFDNAKFLLIVFVVMGHLVDVSLTDVDQNARSLYVFIYAFHMPLFIFLSGLFLKRMDSGSRLNIRRIVGFVILGYATKLYIAIVRYIQGGCSEFSFTLQADSGISWFMFSMAIFTFVIWLVREFDWRLVLAFNIVLALVVGYDSNVGDAFALSRSIVFFPFFYVAYLLDAGKVNRVLSNVPLKLVAFAVLVAWIWLCFGPMTEYTCHLRGLFTGRNPYTDITLPEGYTCEWYFRLLAGGISVLTSFAVLCLIPDIRIPVLTTSGSRSLAVYFFHRGFVIFSYCFLQDAIYALPGGLVWYALLAVPITLLLSWKPLETFTRYLLNCGKTTK